MEIKKKFIRMKKYKGKVQSLYFEYKQCDHVHHHRLKD